MSGSHPTPAEQHLGDRLAALVDGELGHDARERVLAHLATCPKCKAEADAQRRLKNVFAEVAPPPPSESFLARLQCLPEGDDDGETFGRGGPLSRGGPGGTGVFGIRSEAHFTYAPSGPHTTGLPGGGSAFRIHDVGRHDTDRWGSRGRRFAFAAAGAVSLAAMALGGVSTGAPIAAGEPGGSGSGSNATPLRQTGAGTGTTAESERRRVGTGTPLLALNPRSADGALSAPVTRTAASAPLLPGMPAQPVTAADDEVNVLTAPMLAGATALSPLIRTLAPATYASAPEALSPPGTAPATGTGVDAAPSSSTAR